MTARQMRAPTRLFRLVGKTGARTHQGVRSPFPLGSASRRPFFVLARRARLSPPGLRKQRGQLPTWQMWPRHPAHKVANSQISSYIWPFVEDRCGPGPLRLR